MDITQAAFGLDMRSASRIYFINPVLDPQVEAQAIGRARRISQQKPVTVETLVLRDSLEEVIVRRKGEMTQAEQRKCRSILDDRPIYEWILNARIVPLSEAEKSASGPDQTAMLQTPQFIFGRGFGRVDHPDQDLVTDTGAGEIAPGFKAAIAETDPSSSKKRSARVAFASPGPTAEEEVPKRSMVRFAGTDDE
jgi:hypothetical protein